jgi:streptogrisin C
MQRKRIVTVAAMVTVAGTAVALTLPAVAETRRPERGSPARAAASDVAPQLLAAMQRDMGVDGDRARALLKRSTWAAETTAGLRAETGGAYAGSWLAEDGTTLNVAVTDADAAGAVRRAGGTPRLVDRSEHELDQVKAALDGSASRGDRALPGWYVDAATNSVVILAAPGDRDRAEALAEKAGVDADAVTVKTSSSRPRTFADVRGGDAYFIQIGGGQARCSIGFAVTTGFVTAGHCGAEGAQTFGNDNQPLGEVAASVFPGDADAGFVATEADVELLPVVNDFEGNELPVAGSDEAPVGAAVCRSGSTTGTFCGRILAKNQTVNYPEGAVTGLTRTDVCAEGGDSGGSWLSGDQAQGVTSGGSGNCDVGGETFFQPVNEILADNDLTLLTTGNAGDQGGGGNQGGGGEQGGGNQGGGGEQGGGGQEGGQAVDCAAMQATRQGDIRRAGTAQAQPDGLFFRAGAGTQTACLDAPDGADFDVVLQRFSDGAFRTVAQSTGDGDKTLTFDGQAGTYRYAVVATSGTGRYTLGFSVS